MTPVPLHFSAAGLRLAGYMIESQLRVAHALGKAAIASNPFLAKPAVKISQSSVAEVKRAQVQIKSSKKSLSATKKKLAPAVAKPLMKSAPISKTEQIAQKASEAKVKSVTQVKTAPEPVTKRTSIKQKIAGEESIKEKSQSVMAQSAPAKPTVAKKKTALKPVKATASVAKEVKAQPAKVKIQTAMSKGENTAAKAPSVETQVKPRAKRVPTTAEPSVATAPRKRPRQPSPPPKMPDV